MAAFRSMFKALRAITKPGITYDQSERGFYYRRYTDNANADPQCDHVGQQWVRNGGMPVGYGAIAKISDDVGEENFLYRQVWNSYGGVNYAIIGQEDPYDFDSNAAYECALYSITASAGDAETEWDSAPLFLQLFVGLSQPSGNMPQPGDIPDFVLPVPRPPAVLAHSFGHYTPFNGVPPSRNSTGGNRGISAIFSSTRDTYTVTAETGLIQVNWAAYMQYNVP